MHSFVYKMLKMEVAQIILCHYTHSGVRVGGGGGVHCIFCEYSGLHINKISRSYPIPPEFCTIIIADLCTRKWYQTYGSIRLQVKQKERGSSRELGFHLGPVRSVSIELAL